MSTFDGLVPEFPRIRIDRFRLRDGSSSPSLANFLSHIHTDHLVGLDSPLYGGPFIYCSSATKEMLLRLEKYPTRMNFANGLTETRTQTYKHLKKLLKPIPLEVPTWIELSDGYRIRVTLFDANHCAGAVSFLIEADRINGQDAKAILYTGDVRCEQWWVHSLSRYPFLNQYLRHNGKEPHKRLDTIYLDTTFASKTDPYQHFPSKAEGIAELLNKVSQYPKDTLFYLNTWTFGYEDVWSAIATYLDTKIHVDQYKYGVYAALGSSLEPRALDYFKLIMSHAGNHAQLGCLTPDSQAHQIHSCEQGTSCYVWNEKFVRITPIISRYGGRDMREPGAGGGEDDLNRQYEIQFQDHGEMIELIELIASKYQDQPELRSNIIKLLKDDLSSRGTVSLEMAEVYVDSEADVASQEPVDMDDLTLEHLVTAMANRVLRTQKEQESPGELLPKQAGKLPNHIMFPYSRHSSYGELCSLIEAFKPKDIVPCTVVPEKHWRPSHSMSYLFGHLYPEPPAFSHDQMMLRMFHQRSAEISSPRRPKRKSTPEMTSSPARSSPLTLPPEDMSKKRKPQAESQDMPERPAAKRRTTEDLPQAENHTTIHNDEETDEEVEVDIDEKTDAKTDEKIDENIDDNADENFGEETDGETDEELEGVTLQHAFRLEASDAALGNHGMHWSSIGLVSVSGHQEMEEEL